MLRNRPGLHHVSLYTSVLAAALLMLAAGCGRGDAPSTDIEGRWVRYAANDAVEYIVFHDDGTGEMGLDVAWAREHGKPIAYSLTGTETHKGPVIIENPEGVPSYSPFEHRGDSLVVHGVATHTFYRDDAQGLAAAQARLDDEAASQQRAALQTQIRFGLPAVQLNVQRWQGRRVASGSPPDDYAGITCDDIVGRNNRDLTVEGCATEHASYHVRKTRPLEIAVTARANAAVGFLLHGAAYPSTGTIETL